MYAEIKVHIKAIVQLLTLMITQACINFNLTHTRILLSGMCQDWVKLCLHFQYSLYPSEGQNRISKWFLLFGSSHQKSLQGECTVLQKYCMVLKSNPTNPPLSQVKKCTFHSNKLYDYYMSFLRSSLSFRNKINMHPVSDTLRYYCYSLFLSIQLKR